MRVRHVGQISAVDAGAWNDCFPGAYPFARHEFLLALEQHGCVAPDTGWTPCHALLENAEGRLLGAAPLYLKAHSYGEFVFDFSWAEAAHSIGQRYYPKLLNAIPFTPATGPRLGTSDAGARLTLANALPQMAASSKLSSFHSLFPQAEDALVFADAGCVERNDIQFHWHNRGYADFAEFAATLSSAKRKKMLRERRRVAEAGFSFEVRSGAELSEADWARVYTLYSNTYEERGQAPYLCLDFFLDYGRRDATPVRLILAYEARAVVAVAITVLGGDTLYGRHWGAAAHYHSLHFETCYYQGIDYCIRQGLQRFDAGAQGEHKLARGFEPVRTQSRHWLSDRRLRAAVDRALGREREWVGLRGESLSAHSPYRDHPDEAAGDEAGGTIEAPTGGSDG